MKVWIINGPNLNMLGIREPGLYGRRDIQALEAFCRNACLELSAQTGKQIVCEFFQSNHEGALVDKIQEAYWAHVDVHLTDIREREEFRSISYAGMACEAHYIGHGFDGYRMALAYLVQNYGQ